MIRILLLLDCIRKPKYGQSYGLTPLIPFDPLTSLALALWEVPSLTSTGMLLIGRMVSLLSRALVAQLSAVRGRKSSFWQGRLAEATADGFPIRHRDPNLRLSLLCQGRRGQASLIWARRRRLRWTG